MATIADFGEKIGGARKDLYSNLDDLTSYELKKVTRDKVWKKPDVFKLIENGADVNHLYWVEQIRKALPTTPCGYITTEEEADKAGKAFIRAVTDFRDFALSSKSIDPNGLASLRDKYFSTTGYRYEARNPEGKAILHHSLYKVPDDAKTIASRVRYEQFGVTKEQKDAEAAKKRFTAVRYIGTVNQIERVKDANVMTFADNEQSADEHKLTHITYYGKTYYYLKPTHELFDIDGWTPGTYVIIDNIARKFVANNIPEEKKDEMMTGLINGYHQALSNVKKNGKAVKGKFTPPQLKHVVQEGGYETEKTISGEDYMSDLGFRAGEFGNWMNDNDREASLRMGYTALANLATVLGIDKKSVSFGKLAIAFGARGHNAAKAHYEPARRVINLTKMKGAGCLAHEMGHALDHLIGLKAGATDLLSEDYKYDFSTKPSHTEGVPKAFLKIMEAMQYKYVEKENDVQERLEKMRERYRKCIEQHAPRSIADDRKKKWDELVDKLVENPTDLVDFKAGNEGAIGELSELRKELTGHVISKQNRETILYYGQSVSALMKEVTKGEETKTVKVETDYYRGSKYFDKAFAKDGGYWQSKCEMFARAFDCYVDDRLSYNKIHDDYLTAYANSFAIEDETTGEIMRAYPYGEERTVLFGLFDQLIEELIENGTFVHAGKADETSPVCTVETTVTEPVVVVETGSKKEKIAAFEPPRICNVGAKKTAFPSTCMVGEQMSIFDFI